MECCELWSLYVGMQITVSSSFTGKINVTLSQCRDIDFQVKYQERGSGTSTRSTTATGLHVKEYTIQ